jgi:hypothetical protein
MLNQHRRAAVAWARPAEAALRAAGEDPESVLPAARAAWAGRALK